MPLDLGNAVNAFDQAAMAVRDLLVTFQALAVTPPG
jgi:hypothetical protein